VASAGGDTLPPVQVRVGGQSVSIGGAAPTAPDSRRAAQLTLAPGSYPVRVAGVSQRPTVTVQSGQVAPVLLAVRGGRVVPGGIYVGLQEVNLGLQELSGRLSPLPDFHLVDQDGRALDRSAAFIEDPANRAKVAALLAAPHRVGVAAGVIERTLEGRLKVSPDGRVRSDDRYLLVGHNGAARPDPVQAAWLYAQMVRWGQAPLSQDLLAAAKGTFRPDLFNAALQSNEASAAAPADRIGAFAGPPFDAEDISGHLKFWAMKQR